MSLQEFEMIKHRVLGLAMVLLASTGIASNASAQEKTRAEVRQELVQAEDNGLRFVTDASYPDVAPTLVPQVARLQRQGEGGMGGDMSGTGAAGTGAARGWVGPGHVAAPACVGPVSFCTLYFGS
jgi:hypothetical protein